MKNNIGYRFLVIGLLSLVPCLSSLVSCPTADAEEFKAKEPIVVNGDSVEYFHEKKEVIGSGNISITYKDVVLTCDKITVHLDTKEGLAEGNVKITQKDAYFTGDKINYNFDTRVGRVINGYVNAKPFYGKAQEMDKVSEKQVNLERGYVTTCDIEKPHYRVQSREVKIYLEDKIVAKHILFFIGNVPVLYMPYYVQPLDDKKTHITVIPGEEDDWGYYLLTSYRYHLNDKNRGDILLDYRTKKGLAEGVNHYYDTEKVGKGSFKFYYTHENDSLVYKPEGEMRPRHRFQVRHEWEIGENTDTFATLEFNQLSDRDVIKDYFYNEFEEIGDTPDNYISVLTQKQDYTTELLLRKRFDNFYTVVERLPEYRIDIPNYRLFKDLPVYYKATVSGVYLNQTFAKSDPTPNDLNTIRFDAYNQLSYAAKLFRSLSLTPYGAVQETYYSRNKWDTANQVRTIFSGGLDASVKFYRVYNVETDFLGLNIHNLRHIITPTANYYYTHQPTISSDNLNQFDSIDAISARNGVRLGLESKFQTKRLEEGENWRSVDLATFIVSSDYQFRLKKDNMAYKQQKFQTVDFQLELVPYPWFYSIAKMTINTKNSAVQSESIDLVASKGDKWSIGLGHRYESVETGKSNLLTGDAKYKINDKWSVRAYERFNMQNGSFEEQEYTVYRDLHCWLAEFTYNTKFLAEGRDHSFFVVFRLKAFPETPIGFKRTYYRPRFGSTGSSWIGQ